MAIVILGIIAGVLAPVITQNMHAYVDTQSRAQLLDKIRLSVGRLERELRQSTAQHISASGSTLTFVTTTVGGVYVNFNSSKPLITNLDCSRVRNQSPPQLERFLTGEPIRNLCILYPGSLSSLPSQQLESVVVGSDLVPISSVAAVTNGSPDAYNGALWKLTFDSDTTFSSSSSSTNNVVSFADYRHRISLSGSTLNWERSVASDTGFTTVDSGVLLNGVSSFTPSFDIASGMVTFTIGLTDGNESISVTEDVYVRN